MNIKSAEPTAKELEGLLQEIDIQMDRFFGAFINKIKSINPDNCDIDMLATILSTLCNTFESLLEAYKIAIEEEQEFY